MTHLHSLHLEHFRSYPALTLRDFNPRAMILCGPNGAGKTNILEAISLLSPGRGLRGAKISEMQKIAPQQPAGWMITAEIKGGYGPAKLGIARDPSTDKKIIRINGEAAKSQAALGEWLTCLWLTPQMDRIFIDSASGRRHFFDRLVYSFDPSHLGRLTRYENATRQRLRLLKEQKFEPQWLNALESQMAETGLSITAARLSFNEKLQKAYLSATREEQENFPQASLAICGDTEGWLATTSALDTEERFRIRLEQTRKQDADHGTTSTGPHRSDFQVRYTAKSMPAAACSTGEQKALLIGIILAHARLLAREHEDAPVLLLDEIVAHLDSGRRRVLANVLASHQSQIWMSGTDPDLFSDFLDYAALLPLGK